jgi:hypothetical protein
LLVCDAFPVGIAAETWEAPERLEPFAGRRLQLADASLQMVLPS